MRFSLYANASEVKVGAEGHIFHYDFFCVNNKVHLNRKTAYCIQTGKREITWETAAPCNGSCRVWFARELDIPREQKRGSEMLEMSQTSKQWVALLRCTQGVRRSLLDEIWRAYDLGTIREAVRRLPHIPEPYKSKFDSSLKQMSG